jgi:hypothetical protein
MAWPDGLRGLLDRIAEAGTEAHAVARGAVLAGRARVVGGQVEHRMLVAQLGFPVRQLALAFALASHWRCQLP